MLALRSSPPSFSVAEAERIALESHGLAVSAHELAGEREANFRLTTADGRAFILKIFDAAAPAESTDCHIQVLRHLEQSAPSLPVPRVLSTARSGRNTTVLLTYLAGELLSTRQLDSSLLDGLGATVAQLDRGLQGFTHPALVRTLAWDMRRLLDLLEYACLLECSATRQSVERAARAVTDRLTALTRLRAQAVHGDCHGGNVLVGVDPAQVCGVLDFGDLLHAPLVFELAVCLSELLTQGVDDPAALSRVVTGYTRRLPLECDDIEELFDLVTARHASTLLIHAWRTRHDPMGARQLDTSAAQAGDSLAALLRRGRSAFTAQWHAAAGTAKAAPASDEPGLLDRRRRALGSGAELFYEQPLHLVRGRDVWLYDAQGHAYLDVYNNVPHVGHTHPAVVGAIQRQTSLLATHTRYLGDEILEYAEALTARLPPHLDCCIFVNSGSEANDVAWRMARFATGHEGAVIMAHAYHGITEAVAALTPASKLPDAPHVVTLTAPPESLQAHQELPAAELAKTAADTALAVATLAKRGFAPAAFYLDTGITSSGIFDPPSAWAQTVAAGMRAAGALIIADEVQYGLGRSGSNFWGFERRGFVPDVVTLGKPVGNGYPMGIVVSNRALVEAFQARHGFFSTFGGNSVAAAAGLAVLGVLDAEQLPANALATGNYVRERLTALAARYACLGRVRGTGLLLGLEINADDEERSRRLTKSIINHMAARSRVLIGYEGPRGSILKLRPPMTFRREHADVLTSAVEAAVLASAQ